ncbi:hypothetical protein LAZ67_19002436 [Cordylochernes scorpioides]|uniref:Transposase n=1 Tax=Cordylochernes scorpioides TaxID=51811 RepID=A0ABY6LII7_9ARAC|nr:hypothetical protein LAZ67_19002436 [Cordylochernes scorpioides]
MCSILRLLDVLDSPPPRRARFSPSSMCSILRLLDVLDSPPPRRARFSASSMCSILRLLDVLDSPPPRRARFSASSPCSLLRLLAVLDSPPPRRARFSASSMCSILRFLLDDRPVVELPSSETGLSVYMGIMRCLREAVRLKRPERWQNNDWILHVGNARPHTAHVVLQFLAKHSTIQIPHPPYSPDLAPNDFFLYPKLKMNLKGRKFDNVDMIQAESKATLRNLSKKREPRRRLRITINEEDNV